MKKTDYINSKLDINIIFSFFTIFASIIYFIIRFKLDTNFEILRQVLCVSGISFLILNGSFVLKEKLIKNIPLLNLYSISTTIIFFTIILISYLFKTINFPLYWIPVILGFGSFIYVLYSFLNKNQGSKYSILYRILFAGLFSFILFRSVLYFNHMPLQFEGLVAGIYHQDSYFFMSLINIIQSFDFKTMGLDGLNPPINYHVLGLFSLAQMGTFLKIPTLQFFPLSMMTILVPWFFQSLLFLAVDYKALKNNNISLNWYHYLGFVFLIIGLIPSISIHHTKFELIQSILIYYHKFPLCSSHILSIIFMYLMFSSVLNIIKQYREETLSELSLNLYLFLIFPLFTVFITGCKVSGFVLFIPVIIYLIIRFNKINLKSICFISFISFIFLYMYRLVGSFGNSQIASSAFIPFAYFKNYVLKPMFGVNTLNSGLLFSLLFILYFIGLNLPSIIYCFFRVKEELGKNSKALWSERRLVDVEALVILVFIGFVIPELNIGNLGSIGGNGYYFNSVQYYLSIPLCIGLLNINSLPKLNKECFTGLKNNPKGMLTLIAILLILSVFIINLYETHCWIKNGINQVKVIKSKFKTEKRENTPIYQFFLNFKEQGDSLSFKDKREMAVYIPQSVRIFWNSLEEAPMLYPFVEITLSGLPVINGITEEKVNKLCEISPTYCSPDRKRYIYYGYDNCEIAKKDLQYKTVEEFCKLNNKYPFKKYLVAEQKDGNISFNIYNCKN